MTGVNNLRVEDISSDSFFSRGNLAEQYIHQHLHYFNGNFQRPESFYWLRENRKGNAEVDFLLQISSKIIPVEVKAGASGSLKSLLQFMSRDQHRFGLRFDTNLPSINNVDHSTVTTEGSVRAKGVVISLPLYAIDQTKRILESVAS